MADLTHLDKKQLQQFRDVDVEDVRKKAVKHRDEEDSGIRPLGHLVDGHTTADNTDKAQQVLHIGNMSRDPDVSGPTLIENITTVAKSIDKLLGDQEKLFEEMQEALQDTLDKMSKTQQDNLDAIDAQSLLQIFSDVDTATSGSGGTENES